MKDIFPVRQRESKPDSLSDSIFALRALNQYLGGSATPRLEGVKASMTRGDVVVKARDDTLVQQCGNWLRQGGHSALAKKLYPAVDAYVSGRVGRNPRIHVSEANTRFIKAFKRSYASYDERAQNEVSIMRHMAAFLERAYARETIEGRADPEVDRTSMQFLIDHFGPASYPWVDFHLDPVILALRADDQVPQYVKDRIGDSLKVFVVARLDVD